MSKFRNQAASAVLSVVTVVSLVGGIAPVAYGQSAADLQAQISSLLATISGLQGQLSALQGGGGSSYTFTRDLTVGSTGADVKALQQFLNGHGAIVSGGSGAGSPGNESSYFGALTKAALAQWQGGHGVSPAVGYFGPKTRAAINAAVVVTPPVGGVFPAGCTSSSGFSSTTGLSCSPVTWPAGCSSAAGFSQTTGLACSTAVTFPAGCTSASGFSPTTGLACGTIVVSSEGSFTATLAAAPAANPSASAGDGVPVIGVEVQAQGSDITIDRADWQISVTNVAVTTTYNPTSFIKAISVWDGSTKLSSTVLDSTNLTLDSSSRYWIRLSGFSFVVPKGTKKVVTFKVDTITTIDNNRVVIFQDYAGASNSIRGVDTQGTASYADLAAADSRQHTFKSGGASVLTLSTDTANLKARNVFLDGTNGTTRTELLRFTAKSTSGASTLRTLAASSTYTSVQPSTLTLYDGDTVLASASTANNTIFTNIALAIPEDTTKTLTIAANFPSTGNGMVASVSIPAAAGGSSYLKADGSTGTPTAASALNGADVHALRTAAILTFVSATNTKNPGTTGTGAVSASMDGVLTIIEKAIGGTLTLPTSGAVLIGVASDGTATIAATAVQVAVSPNQSLSDGTEGTVTITANRTAAGTGSSAFQRFNLEAFYANFGAAIAANVYLQNYGLSDFVTPYVILP